MKKACRVEFLPFLSRRDYARGTNLLDAVREISLPLKSTCGGKGTCGECLVRIKSGKATSRASSGLPEDVRRRGYALACRTEIEDDLTVELPRFEERSVRALAGSRFFEAHPDRISGVFEVSPAVRKLRLSLPAPTLADNSSDLRRVQRQIQKSDGLRCRQAEYHVLLRLAAAVRKQDGQVTAVLSRSGSEWRLVDLQPFPPPQNVYGLACDLGTTTVVTAIVDLEDGRILSTTSGLNQQLRCGEDVISRIDYAGKPGRLRELQMLAARTVNSLLEKACREAGISSADIYDVSLAGNTTMTHLLLGLDPRTIREEPYIPTVNLVPPVKAVDLGLDLNPEAIVHCAPAVGSYVGGDITAGLLATPILRTEEETSLFIDAGTNGELVIGNRDWLAACACSAGPAFEGGGTKCGLPAGDGAIESVTIQGNGRLEYRVIGGGKPKGVCGSGLVDLLAELFVHGFIDRAGKLNDRKAGTRFVRKEDGAGFLIERASRCEWGRDLVISEKDIANLIRTKGAIYSACAVLLKNIGLAFDRLDAVYLAGGFGEHLNIENAVRIGLLPDLEREKFCYLGNTSLTGAYLGLVSEKNRELVETIAAKMTYLELNAEPGYMNEYTGSLFFPHTDIGLFPTVKKIVEP
ncbi:MAG TPA: ASKHA domain-containing protein [Candidatus Desulfaltia sp.]|nr:ASKHA domain-containing protein [Candidatus Desulfaltia sp.]